MQRYRICTSRVTAGEALRFASSSGLGEIVDLRRYEGTLLVRRAGEAWNPEVLHFEFKGAGFRSTKITLSGPRRGAGRA